MYVCEKFRAEAHNGFMVIAYGEKNRKAFA